MTDLTIENCRENIDRLTSTTTTMFDQKLIKSTSRSSSNFLPKSRWIFVFCFVIVLGLFTFLLLMIFLRKNQRNEVKIVRRVTEIPSRHFYEEPISVIGHRTIEINDYDHVRDNYIWKSKSFHCFFFKSASVSFDCLRNFLLIFGFFSQEKMINDWSRYESIFRHYQLRETSNFLFDQNEIDPKKTFLVDRTLIEKNQSKSKTIDAKTMENKSKEKKSSNQIRSKRKSNRNSVISIPVPPTAKSRKTNYT